jgi:hypothetical protein
VHALRQALHEISVSECVWLVLQDEIELANENNELRR